MIPSDQIKNLTCSLTSANQEILASNTVNKALLPQIVSDILGNLAALEDEQVVSQWKNFSLSIATHLNLSLHPSIYGKIKAINAYISKQDFFPGTALGCFEDPLPLIISHLDNTNTLDALACMSKRWNYYIYTKINLNFFKSVKNVDRDCLKEIVCDIYGNLSSLEDKDLLKKWKNFSSDITSPSGRVLCSLFNEKIKAINAHISNQSFFPGTAFDSCQDPLSLIISHLEDHNTYFSPFSPRLNALGCVSKRWNHHIYQVKDSNSLEYLRLKKEEKLLSHPLSGAKCKTKAEAIDFIIENKLEVANLSRFQDLKEADLEKLFKNCPQLKHLDIQSKFITQLPKECFQLKNLNCCGCSELTSLPDMPELLGLSCGSCSALTELPDMPKLTNLECYGCVKMTKLPNNMLKLIELDCQSCNQLEDLPNMPYLENLNCELCAQIKELPYMPYLETLACRECVSLKDLPNMPHLKDLSYGNNPNFNIQKNKFHRDCKIWKLE